MQISLWLPTSTFVSKWFAKFPSNNRQQLYQVFLKKYSDQTKIYVLCRFINLSPKRFEDLSFDDFKFDVISKFSNPVETRIGEAHMIRPTTTSLSLNYLFDFPS